MKKIASKQILYFALPISVFIFITGGAALAVASSSSDSTPTTTSSGQITDLSSRIALRKTTYNVSLSKAQQSLLANKCQAAQVKLQNIQAKYTTESTSRQDTYTELSTQLNKLIDNLNQENADDSELKTAAGKFNSAISKYTEDSANYKAALDDLAVMDCKADPVGFKATLLNTRELRAQLSKDAEAIRVASTGVNKNLSTNLISSPAN